VLGTGAAATPKVTVHRSSASVRPVIPKRAILASFSTPWKIGTCHRYKPYEIRPIQTRPGSSRTSLATLGGEVISAVIKAAAERHARRSAPLCKSSEVGGGAA
jgi:hypothetical protein